MGASTKGTKLFRETQDVLLGNSSVILYEFDDLRNVRFNKQPLRYNGEIADGVYLLLTAKKGAPLQASGLLPPLHTRRGSAPPCPFTRCQAGDRCSSRPPLSLSHISLSRDAPHHHPHSASAPRGTMPPGEASWGGPAVIPPVPRSKDCSLLKGETHFFPEAVKPSPSPQITCIVIQPIQGRRWHPQAPFVLFPSKKRTRGGL